MLNGEKLCPDASQQPSIDEPIEIPINLINDNIEMCRKFPNLPFCHDNTNTPLGQVDDLLCKSGRTAYCNRGDNFNSPNFGFPNIPIFRPQH